MVEPLSLAQTDTLYEDVKTRISLRGFARMIDQPYWRLRDYRRSSARRASAAAQCNHLEQRVRQAALEEPTYGYRRLWRVLCGQGVLIGRERLRRLLRTLGLSPAMIRKPRRPKAVIRVEEEWPEGRRVQIDATRLSLADGISWVYLVEDIASRVCLASSVGPSVSQERAAETLLAGQGHLVQMGIDESLVIQSDGGSDFTSAWFQTCCSQVGQWIRCRVNQVGGMGILERLNRTFKYESVFRDEIETAAELRAHLPEFERWYNEERLHSRVGYQPPIQALLQEAVILT
jgi:transposase InsO family protein